MSSQGLYNQTASYFIFKSVITVIASFVSVILFTIYYIDYQNNKFNNEPSLISSSSRAPTHASTTNLNKKKKKLKKYTLIETIISRLTSCILIIFCFICVINFLLTIIEQVGRVNELKKLLCTPWTVRIISAWIQFAVGLMHCVFISQLHYMYQRPQLTPFAYKASTLKIYCFFIMNLSALCTVLLLVYLEIDAFDITFLGQDHSSCNIQVPTFLNVIVGGTDMVIVMCLCYLFIKPMRDVFILHKSSDNDIEFSQSQIAELNQISTLALVAAITTFGAVLIIGWTNAIWPLFISMPLNCICLMFMTDYYPNGYKIICCLFIRCRIRLFRKDNKAKLRSEPLHHFMQESSQHMIQLKGLDPQKETEAHLEQFQKPITLRDNNSYDPYGVGEINTQFTDPSYANLKVDVKHEQINTMELKMMDLSPLTQKKQTERESDVVILGNKYLLAKKTSHDNEDIDKMASDSYETNESTKL